MQQEFCNEVAENYSNQQENNTGLRGQGENKRSKWHYRTLEEAWLEEIPQPKEELPSGGE
jgi:hypothetical protein